jgi:hypothetical protein
MGLQSLNAETIESWAARLKCANNAWAIVEALINCPEPNYQTACSIMFDLSWVQHRDWLNRAVAHFEDVVSKPPYAGTYLNAAWLYEYVTYYTTDVEKSPEA